MQMSLINYRTEYQFILLPEVGLHCGCTLLVETRS